MEIYLIRHGHYSPSWENKDDGALTEKGREQVEKLGLRFCEENVCFKQVYSSSKIRAMESAIRCCKIQGIENIIFSEKLIEHEIGEDENETVIRMREFVDKIKTNFRDGSFGIFSHCCAIRYLLNSFSPDLYRKVLPHAGVVLLDYSGDNLKIMDYIYDKHLQGIESY